MRLKKISRAYRVNPNIDKLIKLGCHVTGESESDFIGLCVAAQCESVIAKSRAMKDLLSRPANSHLAADIWRARVSVILRWADAGRLKLSPETRRALERHENH